MSLKAKMVYSPEETFAYQAVSLFKKYCLVTGLQPLTCHAVFRCNNTWPDCLASEGDERHDRGRALHIEENLIY